MYSGLTPGKYGLCPNCGSNAVHQFDVKAHTGKGTAWSVSGCALIVIGLPLTIFGIGWFLIVAGIIVGIVGMFTGNKSQVGTSRECRDCRHRWPV